MTKEKNKFDGKSLDISREKVDKLKEIFPEACSEDKIDFEKLQELLSGEIEDRKERYGLTWAGKSNCFRQIQQPTTATLKPVRDESVDFDNTQNIFIEGENLETLKALQKSYYGKVKMIYIDPPYNTGNDSFIYPDRFQESRSEYAARSGEVDEEGNLTGDNAFRKNTSDCGHFHSNWLNMMYPRLFMARNLLRKDGVIFVSIDDGEVHNLRMVMDEIFGEGNFISQIVWKKKTGAGSGVAHVFDEHEYVLVYGKNKLTVPRWRILSDNEGNFRNPDNDERGSWESCAFTAPSKNRNPNQLFMVEVYFDRTKISFPEIDTDGNEAFDSFKYRDNFVVLRHVADEKKDNVSFYDEENKKAIFVKRWAYAKQNIKQIFDQERVYFNNGNVPRLKKFKSEYEGKALRSIYFNNFSTQQGTEALRELFGKSLVEYPKPVPLLKHIILGTTDENDIVLDFFAGTCTTAHAVMQRNTEGGGNRKYICIQMPEPCDEDGEAYKAGFENIAEIGKERIRRAGEKIKEENEGKLDFDGDKLDLGFKVFRLEQSNFKIWRNDVENEKQLKEQMQMFVDNLRSGVVRENILYELILKSGLDLNVETEKKKANGKEYYSIDNGKLVICLEDKITQNLMDKIRQSKPEKIICLDRAFKGNDQLKTNTILQMESEEIEFKVI